jgi:hypothetical protein
LFFISFLKSDFGCIVLFSLTGSISGPGESIKLTSFFFFKELMYELIPYVSPAFDLDGLNPVKYEFSILSMKVK